MTKLDFKQITDSNLLLYRYVRGSHAYGLATETSDMDEGGVYMCPLSQLNGLGFDYQDQVSDAKADKVWLELNKFMQLLVKSNPTVLESLFIPKKHIIYEHPIMSMIKEHCDEFISKECFSSFYGYGVSQIKKCRGLNKKINNPITERLWPLDFCYTFYGQGSSKIRNWLEYRGLNQKYCGLVNIPNMHDVYGCYYDWGRFFSDNSITFDDIIMYHDYVPARKITDIVNEWKSLDMNDVEYQKLKEEYAMATRKNMVDFIISFYGLNSDNSDSTVLLSKWFEQQKPLGYSGIVNEDGSSSQIKVNLCSVSKGEKPICWISYNESGYSKHCIDYKNYREWEKNRNPVRYESNLNKNYDSKNICHAFRLMNMGIEIAKGEGFNVDRTDIDREFLLKVKNHCFEYDVIMEMLNEKENEMKDAMAHSVIKDNVDINMVNELLLSIRRNQEWS